MTDRYFFEEIEEPMSSASVRRCSPAHHRSWTAMDQWRTTASGRLLRHPNAGNEIGRVEIPRWVSRSDDLLDIVHWIVFSINVEGGRGYPVALQEAHEQAVPQHLLTGL
ncbi:MAG: DNA double-strand break repair nuclease NurA [Thermomicrobiales bacterium]